MLQRLMEVRCTDPSILTDWIKQEICNKQEEGGVGKNLLQLWGGDRNYHHHHHPRPTEQVSDKQPDGSRPSRTHATLQ